jgi:hypothetical protein
MRSIDRVRRLRLEAGVLQLGVECQDTRRHRPVALAVCQFLHVAKLDDASVCFEHGGNDADAAENRIVAKPSDQGLDMPHAVEERHDGRRRTDGGCQIGESLFEREGFYCKENRIERAIESVGGDQPGLQDQIAVRALDLEAGSPELLQPPSPHEERDVPAGLGESSSEVTARRARPHHQDAHRCLRER